jgi:hypothetical protein
MDMLKAHAYVWSLAQQPPPPATTNTTTATPPLDSIRYGGTCGTSEHAQDYVRLIGILDLSDELVYNAPDCPAQAFNATIDHESRQTAISTKTTNNLSSIILLPMGIYQNWSLLTSEPWRRQLERQRRRTRQKRRQEQQQVQVPTEDPTNAQISSPSPKPQQQHVVIHMRRGDVTPCYMYRYLPNWYYLQLLDQYAPNASLVDQHVRVTIFTERPNDLNLTEGLQPFLDRGMTLVECNNHHTNNNSNSNSTPPTTTNISRWCHYDPHRHHQDEDDNMTFRPQQLLLVDADVEMVWNTMLHDATVVILSKSLFSYVPALFTTAPVVVYSRFFYHPLAHWRRVPRHVSMETNVRVRRLARELCRGT